MEEHPLMTGVEYAIPPSFDGSQWGYLFALFGLLMVSLIALSWAWREVWAMVEDRQPLRSPITLLRILKISLLIAAILRGTPDALLLIQWPELSPFQRMEIALADRFMDGIAIIPFALAWLIDDVSKGAVTFQLNRLPGPPSNLTPTWSALKRPAKIAAGTFAIAFAVVFLQ